MEAATHICVYSGSSHPKLAQDIADFIGVPLGKVKITRFPDGEVHAQFGEHVRTADVFIVQPTCKPVNENLMELLIMIDAAKRASAARITAVLPFYGYARPVLVPVIRKMTGGCNDLVVVAPDSGSAKMGMYYGDLLHAGFAVVAKRRLSGDSVASSHLVGDVENKVCIIVDDMTSTCGTLIAAANILKARGARKVLAAVTHCMLDETGRARLLESNIEQLIVTDTIPQNDDLNGRIKVVSMAPILGEAIQRIHDGKSVSTLFSVRD